MKENRLLECKFKKDLQEVCGRRFSLCSPSGLVTWVPTKCTERHARPNFLGCYTWSENWTPIWKSASELPKFPGYMTGINCSGTNYQSSTPFSIRGHFREDTILSRFMEVEFRKEHPATGGDEKQISEPGYALQIVTKKQSLICFSEDNFFVYRTHLTAHYTGCRGPLRVFPSYKLTSGSIFSPSLPPSLVLWTMNFLLIPGSFRTYAHLRCR